MEQELQTLIDTIRKDGIREAEQRAQEIIADATKRAEQIVRRAERQSKQQLDSAVMEIERRQSSSQQLLTQAAHNVVLLTKDNIERLLGKVLGGMVEQAMTTEQFGKMIVGFYQQAFKQGIDGLELQVDDSERDAVIAMLVKELGKNKSKKIVVTPNAKTGDGFKLLLKDGGFAFEINTRTVAEAIATILPPYLQQCVDDVGVQS